MDDLTRERYPQGVPWRERRRQFPIPDEATVRQRRMVLCGVADVNEYGWRRKRKRAKEARLIRTIRRYSA